MRRLRLLRNWNEQGQPSMKRCADGLAWCLRRGGVVVREVTPRTVGAGLPRRLSAGLSRYVAPLLDLPRGGGPALVVDHGNGAWVHAVDADRCAVVCHDLIPLRAARGMLGRDNVSVPALAAFCLAMSGLRRARVVLAPSEATAGDLVTLLGVDRARVAVVPLGVDDVFRREGPRGDVGGPYVLSVGVGLGYKNLGGVVAGFVAARRKGRALRLVRLGTPFPAALRAVLRDAGCVEDVVEVAGPFTDQELARWYRGALALVFPSFHEGYGWPPREALACGTPVVVSDRGALAEVDGPGVFRVTPEEAGSVGEGILAAVAHGPVVRGAGAVPRWAQVVPGLLRALAPVLEGA
jgi:glycosyltransferase involved in cell wall biosynthesis